MSRYPVKRAFKVDYKGDGPITLWGKATHGVHLWRGIIFFKCENGEGFCIEPSTAKRYLSPEAVKSGVKSTLGNRKKLYYEGRYAWAIVALEMKVLMYRLCKVINGTPVSEEKLKDLIKEGVPQYFN